jgi:CheY-like chemotaxis protein
MATGTQTEMQHFAESLAVASLSTKDKLIQNREFLVMLAHELRNPLAPIITSLYLIEQGMGDNVLLKNAHRVLKRQLQHLINTIDGLLDMKKLAENKLHLNKENANLCDLVKEAVDVSQPVLDSRRHTLEVNIPDDPVWLEADAKRIQQVIWSLLNNAAKYTETGGKIRLSVTDNEDQVMVSVKDNGIGIPPDKLPHVFELFDQADHAAHMAQGGGLGMGLTLVQAIVRLHNGTVEAFSEGTGKGSEFVVCLPVLKVQESQPAKVQESQQQPRNQALEILIVDDHTDTSESVSTLLKLQGHQTRLIHNGPGAVELAKIHTPDVILLDIGLPGMDGYQVARELRRELPETLLVAFTGYGQDSDKKRSAAAGFDHHLVKPVTPETLMRTVKMKTRWKPNV